MKKQEKTAKKVNFSCRNKPYRRLSREECFAVESLIKAQTAKEYAMGQLVSFDL